MYYHEGLNQTDIAARLGVTRTTGVLCGRFIDRQGQSVPGDLDDRMIGGYVTHVVTSNSTAQDMLRA